MVFTVRHSKHSERTERGHPVRLSAKRERFFECDRLGLSVLCTLADRMSALRA
jgi:hypothetical protein